MTRISTGTLAALALVAGMSSHANAEGFRGVSVEAHLGYSQFHADGLDRGHVGVGTAVGADFDLGRFVLGAQGTFWWAPAKVRGVDGGGWVTQKTYVEWGAALRAGVLATPSTLIYGKFGYVDNKQRKEFLPALSGGGFGGPTTPGYYLRRLHTHGYQWGGGIDQFLGYNLYVLAEGRYSHYNDHTHTVTGLIGVGYLYGAPEAAPPPPPPPPPPPLPPPI